MTCSLRILAVIPAYREETRIGQVVRAVRELGFDVLVVDDCSPDATRLEAERAGATMVRHPINLGYGGGLQTGYLYARERGYEAVVQLDADGQHDPACICDLLAPLLAGEADVVLGSRFLGRGDYKMPWARRLGQRLFGGLAGLVTRQRVTDPTTGFQALSAKTVALYCTRLFPEDYPDADMLIVLRRAGLRVREVAVQMYPNEEQSMHSGILRPLYYIYKMSLAMLMALCKRLPRKEKP
jgi:glycosyltransferase involved in cell wall biosynthesis